MDILNTPEPRALCVGKWELFDSTDRSDHELAAKLCRSCPMASQCKALLDQARKASFDGGRPTGTWAGQLVGVPRADPRRMRIEAAMFSEREARQAHADFQRGLRDERTKIGERVYQRAHKQTKRKAA